MVTQFILPAFSALVIALLVIPLVKKMAITIGLVDKPNARKVHHMPVPLVGGVSIGITIAIFLLTNSVLLQALHENVIWLTGAYVLLLTGTLDDRFNINAIYRLAIQLACAYAVAASGIRITSFYGLLGIEAIPVWLQYGVTVVLIAGVVNAYNLMDGIDGLIGCISLVGAAVLTFLAYQLHREDVVVMGLTLIGAVVGFLRHNLSNRKIFMGDAGSLFIGFLLVVMSIQLLNATNGLPALESAKVFLLVSGIFLVPVLDSLRVYRARIKRGASPFKADKTHLHHLFLIVGFTHRRSTLLIVALIAFNFATIITLIYAVPVTGVIITGILLFTGVTSFLGLHQAVTEWRERLKKIEYEN